MKIKIEIKEGAYSENTTYSYPITRIEEVEIPDEEMERLYQEFKRRMSIEWEKIVEDNRVKPR